MNILGKKYYLFKFNLIIMFTFAFIIFFLMFFITIIIDKYLFLGLYNMSLSRGILIFVFYMIYAVFHEIIHGIFYIVGGANPKKVVFGLVVEKSIFYCLCKQDISIKAAKISTISPFIYIGLLTYIIGIIFRLPILTLLSITNIAGAGGDIIVYTFLSKLNKNSKFSEFDDPTSFAILSNQNLSKSKILGLKYIGTKKRIDRKDFTRIKITKISYAFILIVTLGIIIIELCEKGILS